MECQKETNHTERNAYEKAKCSNFKHKMHNEKEQKENVCGVGLDVEVELELSDVLELELVDVDVEEYGLEHEENVVGFNQRSTG